MHSFMLDVEEIGKEDVVDVEFDNLGIDRNLKW